MWRTADSLAASVLSECSDSSDKEGILWEKEIVECVQSGRHDGDILWAASSMPIRDLETFGAPGMHNYTILANRGANGIDGLVSSAAGAATASGKSVMLLIGDVSFTHDAGGLLACTRGPDPSAQPLDLTIIVIDNGGGGIFEHLPIAKMSVKFERHFLTPPGIDFSSLCDAYGIASMHAASREEFESALAWADTQKGVRVILAKVCRETSLRHHRALWKEVTQRVRSLSSLAEAL